MADRSFGNGGVAGPLPRGRPSTVKSSGKWRVTRHGGQASGEPAKPKTFGESGGRPPRSQRCCPEGQPYKKCRLEADIYEMGGLGVCVVRDDDGGRGENGAELAGGECFQGAKAAFEFGRG